jgi:hypothetical protein
MRFHVPSLSLAENKNSQTPQSDFENRESKWRCIYSRSDTTPSGVLMAEAKKLRMDNLCENLQ